MSYVFLFMYFFFICGIYFYEYSVIIIFEWLIYYMNSTLFSFIFLFDCISLMFLSFGFLNSGSIIFNSIGYMSGDLSLVRFYFIVFLFILSMLFFILICMMLGWDGLGLVSYCLVIYYQNNISLVSELITVFINRLGYVSLILCIGFF